MTRYQIRLQFGPKLPTVKVTGTFEDGCAAVIQLHRMFPSAVRISAINLDRKP
ncbi:hypothetical protein [Polaromonas sp.]|uniref:hypothetical protein n=1 Tax=Polaromonas sp. TaxID=1869339 RepID=UPI003263FF90